MPETGRRDWTGYKIPGTKAAYVSDAVNDIPFSGKLLCECRVEKHLSICLVERLDADCAGQSEYVVWYYNHEDGGFHQGSYIDRQYDAYAEFNRRVAHNLPTL